MTQIWADISGNHGGELDKARNLIADAAYAGCAAVKFQAYKPDDMDKGNRALYEKYAIPVMWYPMLFKTAADFHIPIFASVFGLWAINVLEGYGCGAYKFAARTSTELPWRRYDQMAAAIKDTGKTFIVSSSFRDLDWARSFKPDILLYCDDHSIMTDKDFLQMRGIGFSCHSSRIETALAAIGAGVTHIEKHIKLPGDEDCIDAKCSIDRHQMKILCDLAK